MAKSDRTEEAHKWRTLYKDKRWCGPHGLRQKRLRSDPYCVMCLNRQGILTPATVVDHIKEHKGNRKLFFDYDNTQSLCKLHHDSTKQSEERRGFSTAVGTDGWPIDCNHPGITGKVIKR